MGSLFGGGEDENSKKMIEMQEQEAAQARADEAERQVRINTGLANISALFEGGDINTTTSNAYDWSGFAPTTSGAAVSGLPEGYTYYYDPGTAATSGTTSSKSGIGNASTTGDQSQLGYGTTGSSGSASGTGGGTTQTRGAAATAATPGAWYIMDAEGNKYAMGSDFNYDTVVSDPQEGFTQEFYDKYKQGILDYYNPQVAQKYGEARDETTYRLARAGTLESSAAAQEVAKLYEQNLKREGEVRSQADTATAELESRVNAEKNAAIAQLYATEDPEVATSQATHAVENISAEQPDLSPLGQIFDVAAIGGTKFAQGASNAEWNRKIAALNGGSGSSTVIPT